jgi:NDP-sugar pyrophosphorylase family protein
MQERLTGAVILAAGKGTRLYPLSHQRSKAMTLILDVPIIERIIENLASIGLSDFIIVAQPNDHRLIQHFRCHSTLDLKVHLIFQHQPLGTADALKLAKPLIRGAFILSACDNLINPIEISLMISAWESNPHLAAILGLMLIDDGQRMDCGIVEMDGDKVTRIIEKPVEGQTKSRIASLPIYCFSQRILDYLEEVPLSPRGEYEIQDAIQAMITNHLPINGVFINRRLTLTKPKDLLAINKYYFEMNIDYAKMTFFRLGPHCQLIPPFHIGSGTILGSNCSIGPYVYIQENCRIGDRVQLQDVIVMEGVTLADDTTITSKVIF